MLTKNKQGVQKSPSAALMLSPFHFSDESRKVLSELLVWFSPGHFQLWNHGGRSSSLIVWTQGRFSHSRSRDAGHETGQSTVQKPPVAHKKSHILKTKCSQDVDQGLTSYILLPRLLKLFETLNQLFYLKDS